MSDEAVLVCLPDGSLRFFHEPHLTAAEVLLFYPGHVLGITEEAHLAQLPPLYRLRPGGVYYLSQAAQKCTRVAPKPAPRSGPLLSTQPSSCQYQRSGTEQSGTEHLSSHGGGSMWKFSDYEPECRSGQNFRSPGAMRQTKSSRGRLAALPGDPSHHLIESKPLSSLCDDSESGAKDLTRFRSPPTFLSPVAGLSPVAAAAFREHLSGPLEEWQPCEQCGSPCTVRTASPGAAYRDHTPNSRGSPTSRLSAGLGCRERDVAPLSGPLRAESGRASKSGHREWQRSQTTLRLRTKSPAYDSTLGQPPGAGGLVKQKVSRIDRRAHARTPSWDDALAVDREEHKPGQVHGGKGPTTRAGSGARTSHSPAKQSFDHAQDKDAVYPGLPTNTLQRQLLKLQSSPVKYPERRSASPSVHASPLARPAFWFHGKQPGSPLVRQGSFTAKLRAGACRLGLIKEAAATGGSRRKPSSKTLSSDLQHAGPQLVAAQPGC